MPKVFTSKSQKTGEIGESVAVKFLMKRGYEIIERNYTKKWGEIDIIAQKSKKIYFIEVKALSVRNLVSYETNAYRPEENMHEWKLKRFSRTVETYLLEKNIPEDADWQCDLLVVLLDMTGKRARVKVIEQVL